MSQQAREAVESVIVDYGNHESRWKMWPAVQQALDAYTDAIRAEGQQKIDQLTEWLRIREKHEKQALRIIERADAQIQSLTEERDRLKSRVDYLEGVAMPHARSQANADGFQVGWHAALQNVRDGAAPVELQQLVPDPVPNWKRRAEQAGAERDHLLKEKALVGAQGATAVVTAGNVGEGQLPHDANPAWRCRECGASNSKSHAPECPCRDR